MKKFWKSQEWIIPELELVRGIILYGLESNPLPGDDLTSVAHELFDPPGKMIRPGLFILASHSAKKFNASSTTLFSRAVRGGIQAADKDANYFLAEIKKRSKRLENLRAVDLDVAPLPGFLPLRLYILAAAIELLHSATLLHDDVLDNADLRRGMPTVPRKIGNRQAILLGDHLLTTAFEMVSESASIGSAKLLSRVTAGICRGEMLQNSMQKDIARGSSLRGYKQRIAGKTAAMLSLSLYIGTREVLLYDSKMNYSVDSMAAGDYTQDPPLCRHLRRYGYNLGMAFQIIDDVLDLDIESKNGKTKGQDIQDGIITLPLIFMLQDGVLSGDSLEEIWNNCEEQNLGKFLCRTELRAACIRARSSARLYADRGERELLAAEAITGSPFSALRSVTGSLMERQR